MSAEQIEADYDKCGTYAGWNLHRQDRTKTCDDCKAAQRAYMREYRKRNPYAVAQNRAFNRAQTRALFRLAHMHPAQFQALLTEERDKEKRTVRT